MDAPRSRISGPLLERIDLHVEVPALAYEELETAPLGEGTAPVRALVERARAVQRERLRGAAIYCNALGLSARGYARVLKVARTIADPAAEPKIGLTHIAESIQYREQPRHLS